MSRTPWQPTAPGAGRDRGSAARAALLGSPVPVRTGSGSGGRDAGGFSAGSAGRCWKEKVSDESQDLEMPERACFYHDAQGAEMPLRSPCPAKVAESLHRANYPEKEMKLIPDKVTLAVMIFTFAAIIL